MELVKVFCKYVVLPVIATIFALMCFGGHDKS